MLFCSEKRVRVSTKEQNEKRQITLEQAGEILGDDIQKGLRAILLKKYTFLIKIFSVDHAQIRRGILLHICGKSVKISCILTDIYLCNIIYILKTKKSPSPKMSAVIVGLWPTRQGNFCAVLRRIMQKSGD